MAVGALEIGGSGSLGLAFEATLGTYVAAEKWIPIRSESLQVVEDKIYRMNIRQSVDRTGAVQGFYRVEGDISFEVTGAALLYFLYASRVTAARSGAGPYTYTFTPATVGKVTTDTTSMLARKSLSITVQRSQLPMGYSGCAVGQLAFSLDNGLLMCTASIVGMVEAAQTVVSPSFDATVPFGPGKLTVSVPSGTPRADADTFTMNINDNLVADNRLNGARTPSYLHWGEREVTAGLEIDFSADVDFAAYTAQTAQTFRLLASNSATDSVQIDLAAAITDSDAINLGAIGDLNRQAIAYHGIDTGSGSFTIVDKTAEAPTSLGT